MIKPCPILFLSMLWAMLPIVPVTRFSWTLSAMSSYHRKCRLLPFKLLVPSSQIRSVYVSVVKTTQSVNHRKSDLWCSLKFKDTVLIKNCVFSSSVPASQLSFLRCNDSIKFFFLHCPLSRPRVCWSQWRGLIHITILCDGQRSLHCNKREITKLARMRLSTGKCRYSVEKAGDSVQQLLIQFETVFLEVATNFGWLSSWSVLTILSPILHFWPPKQWAQASKPQHLHVVLPFY